MKSRKIGNTPLTSGPLGLGCNKMLDPANADWRYNFALTHMMECYYLEGDGQIESARQALKKFDSLIQNLTLLFLSLGSQISFPQYPRYCFLDSISILSI